MMSKLTIGLAVLTMASHLVYAQADEILMTSGERFTSSRVWEEGDRIRFSMQGLVVSVDKREVAAIIQSKDKGGDLHTEAGQALPPASASELPEIQRARTRSEEHNEVRRAGVQMAPASSRKKEAGFSSSQNKSATTKGIGLNGFFWGMFSQALPGLEKVHTDPAFGGIDQYQRPGQALLFGDAPLDGWVYGFWNDQLYSIMMWADGRRGYERMRDEVFSRYGRGTRSKSTAERHIWAEQDTQRMLEFDPTLKTGILIMRSRELHDRIKERYP
ncbi:MAG: hypothetical protein C4519_08770 [Desulfobacteraceae bacterium]|nr:MAG: hypothetical protein C4519_08770 [Desulfobacteraceae bacterium]